MSKKLRKEVKMSNIKEDFVSFEIGKLLKEKGFREVCSRCYGVAVLHNGMNISFDEECELKHEGRGDEIKYVEGGVLYDLNYKNSDDDANVWSAPTLWVAMKWLREVHNIDIDIDAHCGMLGIRCYSAEVLTYKPYKLTDTDKKFGLTEDDVKHHLVQSKRNTRIPSKSEIIPEHEHFDTYEKAVEAAIKYCLENLI
jgi:hypothetical protein